MAAPIPIPPFSSKNECLGDSIDAQSRVKDAAAPSPSSRSTFLSIYKEEEEEKSPVLKTIRLYWSCEAETAIIRVLTENSWSVAKRKKRNAKTK